MRVCKKVHIKEQIKHFINLYTSFIKLSWKTYKYIYLERLYSEMINQSRIDCWTGVLFIQSSPCVGLSAALHKNYGADFHHTRMEVGSRPRIDPADFWCVS